MQLIEVLLFSVKFFPGYILTYLYDKVNVYTYKEYKLITSAHSHVIIRYTGVTK